MYDLIILDVRMPDMNGLELYKEIKKIDDKVKVRFLTSVRWIMSSLKKNYFLR